MEKRFFKVIVGLLRLMLVFGCYGTAFADAGYMGSEACGGCHSGIYEGFIKSVHGKESLPESPANGQGCESCHGPGAAHAEKEGGRGVGIFAFTGKISARDRSVKMPCLPWRIKVSGILGNEQAQVIGCFLR